MSEKHLTESPWKAIAVKQKVKDPGLGRALAAYGKADETDYDARLEALDGIEKHAEALAKEHKKNEDVADYLDEVLKQAGSSRKAVEALEKSAAKEVEKQDGEGDDEEEAGAYADRLLGAFKKLKSMPGKPMKYVVCDARPFCGLNVGKRISPKNRTELTELTGGGKKFLPIGECCFENDTYVFTCEQKVPGLARRLQKAVKNYTGKKFKISCGGETVEENDESPDIEEGAAPAVAGPAGRSDDLGKFNERLKTLIPQIKAKPEVKAFAGTPGEKSLNALAGEAGACAQGRDFAKANVLLDTIESLLKGTGDEASVGPGRGPQTVAAGGGTGGVKAGTPPVGGAATVEPGVGPGPGPGVQAGGAQAGTSPEKVIYDRERDAVAKLRADLGKHKQAAHVSDKTTRADAALAAAATHAGKPDWPKAMAELASAKKACEEGKGFADGYADYLTKRAEANLVLTAAQTSGWTGINALPAQLTAADTKAAPPTRNYAGAKTDLDTKIIAALAPFFKKFYVDDVKPNITALKALAGAKFITAEIAEIDRLMLAQQTGITGKEWRQVRLNAGLIADRMAMATKIATRRAAFDTERPKADVAMKTLQGNDSKAIAAPLAELQKRLKAADTMASKAGMQFEDATAEVKAIVKETDAFDRLARSAKTYTTERGALATELNTLRKHAAAEKIKAELDVARGALDEAAKAAGDKGAPGTVLVLGVDRSKHDIATANVRLAQARADLASARKLADGLAGLVAVEGAVKGKSGLPELAKAAAALGKEIEAAKKDKNSALAKDELTKAQTALDEAKKKIDAKQAEPATKALATVAQKVTEARRIEIEHARFVERHTALSARHKQHTEDKGLLFKIKAKVDSLGKALADADAAEKKADHAKAMAALNAAENAAGTADAALASRKAFDVRASLAQLDLDKPANAAIKIAQLIELKKARDLATAFDFAGADKAIDAILKKIGAAELEGMAKKTPPDPKLAEKAKKLAEAGATKELDALIKSLPNSLDKKVFMDLAEARFKIDFLVEADGHEQASMKRMCALMKDIPDDVIGNPSLKRINRRVTKTDGSGTAQTFPYYTASDNEVVMNSRPKLFRKSEFEPGATGFLPPREPGCEPANNKPEDLFDFNMLHELAHSIDDAKNYMGSNGSKPDHGGWIQHGGNVAPIVDAVVKATGFGTTPEERKYITDRILRNPAVPPATVKGDKAKFETFITAAQTDNVWDSQSESDKATLGTRIYHEAYPNTWVSYLADARKKGITSYQFRAPGEWFSELYAAWKLKKLKPAHPAVKWLSTLKV